MAATGRSVLLHLLKSSGLCPHRVHPALKYFSPVVQQKRYQYGKTERGVDSIPDEVVEKHRKGPFVQDVDPERVIQTKSGGARGHYDHRHVHPDFLPSPNWLGRDRIKEKLEREDMYRRRAVVDIPEFYVGSIMAVTIADEYSPGKKNRFVGICIHRECAGLKHFFVLRNVVDGIGVEIKYDMYNPLVQSIEVLRLEKRLDDSLYYLRDAPNEYSTFPFDMTAIPLPKGTTVPVNTTVVKLNPRGWCRRWERMNLKGAEFVVNEKRMRKAKLDIHTKPHLKHDLMHEYRTKIHPAEAGEIMDEVFTRQEKDAKKKLQMKREEGRK